VQGQVSRTRAWSLSQAALAHYETGVPRVNLNTPGHGTDEVRAATPELLGPFKGTVSVSNLAMR